ncbi:hypothetical protein D3C76_765580 [compost metagenome]
MDLLSNVAGVQARLFILDIYGIQVLKYHRTNRRPRFKLLIGQLAAKQFQATVGRVDRSVSGKDRRPAVRAVT